MHVRTYSCVVVVVAVQFFFFLYCWTDWICSICVIASTLQLPQQLLLWRRFNWQKNRSEKGSIILSVSSLFEKSFKMEYVKSVLLPALCFLNQPFVAVLNFLNQSNSAFVDGCPFSFFANTHSHRNCLGELKRESDSDFNWCRSRSYKA